jgi:hypothetical protein
MGMNMEIDMNKKTDMDKIMDTDIVSCVGGIKETN